MHSIGNRISDELESLRHEPEHMRQFGYYQACDVIRHHPSRWIGILFIVLALLPIEMYAQEGLMQLEAKMAQIFDEGQILAYQEAAAMYLDMMHQSADVLTANDQEVLTHHLAYMLLVMPRDDNTRAALEALYNGTGTHQDSQRIVSWWHRADPLPATIHNERIEEHLYRVYYAKRNYSASRDSLGIDDRGRIFIRLGDPFRQTSIKLRTAGLRMQPYEGTLPRNEVWVYRGIHDDAHYLFIQQSRRRPFKISATQELIPPNLRANRRKATLLLTWLEEILAQLALEHPHYGAGYDAVTNYLTLATSDARPPFYFAKFLMEDQRLRDDHHQVSRASSVPASATQVYGIAQQLEPSVRWARFLRPNGETKLEVYWSLDSVQLRPRRRLVNRLRRDGLEPSDDYLMVVTGTHRREDFAPTTLSHRYYRVPAGSTGSLPVHTWESDINGTMQNLAMQWQQYWADQTDDGRFEPTATLGIGVMVMDSIQALRGDGLALEMSDIRPVAVMPAKTTPYPGRLITAETSLGLYFELYHLALNDDGQSRYEVAYTISSNDETKPQSVSTSTIYEGDSRMTQTQLLLDLSTWTMPGPITIAVSATDLVVGKSVERKVPFVYR